MSMKWWTGNLFKRSMVVVMSVSLVIRKRMLIASCGGRGGGIA